MAQRTIVPAAEPQAEAEAVKAKAKGEKLIEEERAEVGGVRWAVYLYYMRCIGHGFFAFTLLLLLAYQGFQLGGNIWLSVWTADPAAAAGDQEATNMYLAVYGVLGLLQSAFVLVGTACLMAGTLDASAKMHSTMLHKYSTLKICGRLSYIVAVKTVFCSFFYKGFSGLPCPSSTRPHWAAS